MTISRENLEKNLQKREIKTNQQENILSHDLKNQIIQRDIGDESKTLDKDKLINTQAVNMALKEGDAENLQDVLDMDLYQEYNINFENLPRVRLARERSILRKGPTHLKGCTKWWARKKWTRKQKGRVKKAEKLLVKHEKLVGSYDNKNHVKILGEYDKYKEARMKELEGNISNITSYYANKEQQGDGNLTEMLNTLNTSLARDAILTLNQKNQDAVNELDKFIRNYELDQPQIQAQKKEINEKEERENELLGKGRVRNRTLQTKVESLDGKNQVELKDMSDLFKKVLSDSGKPFTEEKDEGGHIVQKDLSAQRFEDMKRDAEKVLNYATDLGIAVPEELYFILKLEDNPLLKNGVDKFGPKDHGTETYVLLMSATSKVFYEALNRFAGYIVTDGLDKYYFSEDKERNAITAFIREQGITVIEESQFIQQDSTTDLSKNEFVYLAKSGIYMQIVRKGCGKKLEENKSVNVLFRFSEFNILADTMQLRNDLNPRTYDKMSISRSSATISGSFVSGVMLSAYGTSAIPNAFLVPFHYVNIGRPQVEGDEISYIKMIVPHSQGQTYAQQYVYPCFYTLTLEREN